MKLPCVQWKVAYRDKLENDKVWKVIKNPWWGWAADPFLFENNGITYLFAEIWDYRIGKGGIGYKILSERHSSWRIIIEESYHLSYPHIIKINGMIYMCPESSSNNSIYFYKAVEFPEYWEKMEPLCKGKYCDTTFVQINRKYYGFTCSYHEKPNKLLIFEMQNGKAIFLNRNPLLEGKAMTRPGGEFYLNDGQLIRVSQDCSNFYGEALFFTEVLSVFPTFNEKIIKRYTVDDLILNKSINAIGIHTYNHTKRYEVIDLKLYKINFVNIFWRVIARLKKIGK